MSLVVVVFVSIQNHPTHKIIHFRPPLHSSGSQHNTHDVEGDAGRCADARTADKGRCVQMERGHERQYGRGRRKGFVRGGVTRRDRKMLVVRV